MNYSEDCSSFKLNRFLLRCFGLWPYQPKFGKYFHYLVFVSWTLTAAMAMIQGLSDDSSTDSVIFVETVVALVSTIGNARQFIFLHVNEKKIERLFKRIERDWASTSNPMEMAILKKLSRQAKSLINIYLAISLMGYAWFVSLAYLPLWLDESIATNYSKFFPYYSEDWVINLDYRNVQVFLHASLGALFSAFITVANISLFITSVMHICAMYSIVSYRLKNLVKISILVKTKLPRELTQDEDKIIEQLVAIIAKHKHTIKSVQILHKVFSNSLFVAQIFLMCSMPILIFDLSYRMDKSLLSASRLIFISAIYIGYSFFINLGGQLITEHSNQVFMSTHFMRWYLLPRKAQRMLLILIMRSRKADRLTNGLITISLENFSMMIKASWSFAAVLLTMQRKNA